MCIIIMCNIELINKICLYKSCEFELSWRDVIKFISDLGRAVVFSGIHHQ